MIEILVMKNILISLAILLYLICVFITILCPVPDGLEGFDIITRLHKSLDNQSAERDQVIVLHSLFLVIGVMVFIVTNSDAPNHLLVEVSAGAIFVIHSLYFKIKNKLSKSWYFIFLALDVFYLLFGLNLSVIH